MVERKHSSRGIWSSRYSRSLERPALLLVTGYSCSSSDWSEAFLDRLAEHFQVFTFDARGMGRSQTSAEEGSYVLEEQLLDIDSVLEAWQLESFHLLGYSYGGVMAHEWTQRRPETVKRLSYLSTTPGGEHYTSPDPSILLSLARPEGKTPLEKSETLWKLSLGEESFLKHRGALLSCFKALDGHYPRGLACREQLKIYGAYRWRPLPRDIPVDIIHGKEDPLAPVENAHSLKALETKARLHILEGIRHMPHIECPEKLITLLRLD